MRDGREKKIEKWDKIKRVICFRFGEKRFGFYVLRFSERFILREKIRLIPRLDVCFRCCCRRHNSYAVRLRACSGNYYWRRGGGEMRKSSPPLPCTRWCWVNDFMHYRAANSISDVSGQLMYAWRSLASRMSNVCFRTRRGALLTGWQANGKTIKPGQRRYPRASDV